MKRIFALAITLAVMTLGIPLEASAFDLGQCAHQRDPEKKIASCIEASKSSPYPRVLHWVYRELARAHRERGEIQNAIASYTQSLAAEEREGVRREMEELTHSRSDIASTPPPPGSRSLVGASHVDEAEGATVAGVR